MFLKTPLKPLYQLIFQAQFTLTFIALTKGQKPIAVKIKITHMNAPFSKLGETLTKIA